MAPQWPDHAIASLDLHGWRGYHQSDVFVLLGGWVPTIAYQYDPCKMCQINACERAANQSRLCETRLVLKLKDSTYYNN